jgi:hypothetical protein
MLLIFPAVFLVVGLGLGCGLAYANYRTRNYLRSIENARLYKAGSPVNGLIKIQGVARAVNARDLLVSPIEQQPCVYYHLVIERYHNSTPARTTASVRRGPSGYWERIIEDTQSIPMVISDETGEVPIDPKAAQLDLKSSRRHANMFHKLPPALEQSLRDRYKIVTSTGFFAKQMRYTEVVIAQDAEAFVLGDCEVRDGKATFTTKNHPLLLSFRKEENLLRNGKIAAAIMAVASVVVPILFLLLAWYTYSSTSAQFKPGNQGGAAKANDGKEDSRKEGAISREIAKLKNPGANLSERAWAARKLPEAPAGDIVAEVAPYLNPLLQSKDGFHRESALRAIERGWGTQANEATLKQLLRTTRDAKVQNEILAAIKCLGK